MHPIQEPGQTALPVQALDLGPFFLDGKNALVHPMEALDQGGNVGRPGKAVLFQGNFKFPDLGGIAGLNKEVPLKMAEAPPPQLRLKCIHFGVQGL